MKGKHNYHSVWNVYWAQCTLWQAVSGWSQLSSLSQFSEKDYHFLNLKMPLLSTHFISIFTRSCQIHCFLHTVPAIQQSWKFRVSIWQCTVLNKNFIRNGNYAFLSCLVIFFFSYSLVKNMIFWGFTEPGSKLQNHHFFSLNFGEMEMSK